MKYQPQDIIPAEELPDGAEFQLANLFRNFLHRAWVELFGNAPSANQLAMADWLQFGGEETQTICFRGVGKSYVTVMFCVWLLYRDKDTQVLVTSASGSLSTDNARFAWTLINNFTWLAHMVPTNDQARSQTDWDVRGAKPAKGTSFAARGIFGQITGLRADVIVGDDCETPNTSATPGSREELRKRIGEFTAIIKPGGKTVFLGTAQTEETIYRDNEALGFKTLIIPIIYPSEKEIIRYGEHRLAPHILKAVRDNPALAGTSTELPRFTDADIAKRKIKWGNREFERQFLMHMDAGAGNARPLHLRNLMVLPLEPWNGRTGGVPEEIRAHNITSTPIDHMALDIDLDTFALDNAIYAPDHHARYGKPDEIVMHVDPSGAGDDETAWAVTCGKTGRVFLLEIGSSLKGYSDSVLEQVAACAKKWGVTTIFVEGNLGGGMFGSLLKPKLASIKHPCSVEEERVGKQFKEKRIVSAMEPITTSKRLVVNLDVLRWDFHHAATYSDIEEAKRRFYRFTYQYTRMEEVRDCLAHDDRLDVVASACLFWADRVEEEEQEAESRAFADALQKEIDHINNLRMARGLPLLEQAAHSGKDRNQMDLAIQRAMAQTSGQHRSKTLKDRRHGKRSRSRRS